MPTTLFELISGHICGTSKKCPISLWNYRHMQFGLFAYLCLKRLNKASVKIGARRWSPNGWDSYINVNVQRRQTKWKWSTTKSNQHPQNSLMNVKNMHFTKYFLKRNFIIKGSCKGKKAIFTILVKIISA